MLQRRVNPQFLVDPHPDAQPTSAAERTNDHLRILFIGNSLTFAHGGQALILQRLVESARRTDPSIKPIIAEHLTLPGKSLEQLWQWGEPQRRIGEGNWDFVILQDYSRQPLDKRKTMDEYLARFAAGVKLAHAQPVLFETWSNAARPQDQAAISAAYHQNALLLNALLLPAGEAWSLAMRQQPGLRLHDWDDRHANPAGAYLTACLFFTLLYHRSPQGLTANVADQGVTYIDLPNDQAVFLQSQAAGAILENANMQMTDENTHGQQ